MAKRGNGEGTIFQRKSDGRYVASLTVETDTGKRARKYVYGHTRGEVASALTKLLKDSQLGMPVQDDRVTVGRFLDDWLQSSVRPSRRPSTYAGYENLVRNHIRPFLGHVRLSRLTPQQVEKMQASMIASGSAPRTAQYARSVLRAALGRAVAWGYVGRNVAALASPPTVRRKEISPLTPEQVQTFLRGVQGDRLEALYVTAFTLGLRQGELLGLSWDDVNLSTGTVRVRKALTRAKGPDRFGEPKSASSKRTLQLPEMTLSALRAHRVRQAEERLAAGSDWQDLDLVFTTRFGTPLEGNNVRHYYQRHLVRLGLPRQRFHDIRHSCATLLLSLGVPTRVVMEIMGHSQISLTVNTYQHVIPELQRDAASRIDGLLAANL